MEQAIISLDDIKQASNRIINVVKKTNLIKSDFLSHQSANEIYLKPENLQVTGSYKIRGAYNRLQLLTDEEKKHGIIASSAGNHAQGVAYASKKANIKSTIVMPKTTPLIKVNSTKAYGSEVILYGDCYDEAYQKAKEISKEKNLTFIHPFNDKDVIAGQGTIALEILEELPSTDIIVIPIGGGGLISGIAIAAKAINPKIKIIGVEPKGADSMKKSIEAGKIIELESTNTLADGVAVKKPGELAFEITKNLVDKIITVTEEEIMEAFLTLMEKHKLICEPAGALSIAAVLNKELNGHGKKIVAVISGGNIDVITVSTMVSKGLIKMGRIFEFCIDLIDKPGELLKIAKILSDENANIIKMQHDQFKDIDRHNNVRLIITIETDGHNHIAQITNSFKSQGYDIYKKE